MQSRFDPARLAELDNYAVNAPSSVQGTISGLAAYLAKPARDDFEKSRLLYRWVAQNIAYDAPAFFSNNIPDQSAETVLNRRTAVCGGYSNLFLALGKAAGLDVVIIDGWAKAYAYDMSALDGDPDHAWNGLRVGSAWYLIDSTWGAGSVDESHQFIRKFEPYYWLTPPEQFVYKHFPQDSKWQLLASPVSKAGFSALPDLRAGFFNYGLQLPAGTVSTTQTASRASLLVSTPPDVYLSAAVQQNGQRLPDMWAFAQRNGAQYEVEGVFPGPGRFELIIFAKRGTDSGSSEGVATLGYEVSQGEPTFVGFPTLLGPFFSYGLQLQAGVGALNRVSSRTSLLIGTPPDVFLSAAIEQNGQRLPATWTFAQRNGAQYEVEAVFPGPGKYDLIVFAKRGTDAGSSAGAAILGYDVSQGQATFAGFPKVYLGFAENNGYLYSPKESGLAMGSSQVFKVSVPKAQDAEVVQGTAWTKLPKQGDVFQASLTITAKPVKVCVAFDTSGNYSCLLEWQ